MAANSKIHNQHKSQ